MRAERDPEDKKQGNRRKATNGRKKWWSPDILSLNRNSTSDVSLHLEKTDFSSDLLFLMTPETPLGFASPYFIRTIFFVATNDPAVRR